MITIPKGLTQAVESKKATMSFLKLENGTSFIQVPLQIEGPGKNCGLISSFTGEQGERKLVLHPETLPFAARPSLGQAVHVMSNGKKSVSNGGPFAAITTDFRR